MAIKASLQDDIRSLLEKVLQEQHSEYLKQTTIKDMHGRLSFACPYCGDSAVDELKTRGNLYWDTLQYHCYNCGLHKDVKQLLEDHNVYFKNTQDSIDVIEFIKANTQRRNTTQVLESELFVKLKEYSVDIKDIFKKFNCFYIKPDEYGFEYLKSRLCHTLKDNFLYSQRYNKLFIVNKLPDGSVLSFQIRELDKKGARYLTFNLEKIRTICGFESLFDLEDDKTVTSLCKLSTLFGIGSINLARPFTLFEGPIDSMFMHNSLGLTTVKRDTSEFDEMNNVRYMLDNDSAGKEVMLKKLKKGKKIFLWKKLIEDYSLGNEKIKDLNDLIIVCYRLKCPAFKNLENYFSDNSLDIVYV